ncbi:excinuclease ABC subunit B [Candidatus Magnetobacterium bavaricum]|uniref:UvrABC system protein B n=1 Tax=Candidatus Magnetobacterium bavaricum TaxID=29290 RepID=A0A0F3GY17_9BACT|nr:excinuclease ABC subunit B [Candidatus Magnetobacterium bavaricum]
MLHYNMGGFRLVSDLLPTGDQPQAIGGLVKGVEGGYAAQVLLGVTGSGKTFTVANVIDRVNKPTLVIAHNKTLAAQLYGEFKELFPDNAVEYFVSFYDYYQPEAYIPTTDTYIAKDSMINEDIDRLRHSATMAILERGDTIVVASVSCIYGIGSPQDYLGMHLVINEDDRVPRNKLIEKLTELQYNRTESDFKRGTLRVRGDILEVFPSFSRDMAIRIELFGDDVEGLYEFDPLTGQRLRRLRSVAIYPNTHWITPRHRIEAALEGIKSEMLTSVEHFLRAGKVIEARRIEQRTMFDMEMLKEFGFCSGIENYSRHLSGRAPGEPPFSLIDYFGGDFLTIIDESHVTVPQVRGMYEGDRSRKQTLIDYGFRLPSALDNRPLTYVEFDARIKQVIYVSATPAEYEVKKSRGRIVEQIIRPTGLLDPEMSVRGVSGQVDDLAAEIRQTTQQSQRILVTTLTKKMAEGLADYYNELGLKTRYLHSDIDTLERVKILHELRLGVFDVLIGVNLLREGLDLPEVSLVAILDADKEGFLRSERAIIQTAGRAARNVNGRVILYADKITGSMRRSMDETARRRQLQLNYNQRMGITPTTVKNNIKDILASIYEADYWTVPATTDTPEAMPLDEQTILALQQEMKEAAKDLDFERAALLRDKIKKARELALRVGLS